MLIFLSLCLVWSCSGRLLTPEDPSAGTGRLCWGWGWSHPPPQASRRLHGRATRHRAPTGVLGPKLKMPSAVTPGTKNVQCNIRHENFSTVQMPTQNSGSAHSTARAGSLVVSHAQDGPPAAGDRQTGPWGEGHAPGRCFCRKTAHGHVPLVCALPDNGTNVRPDPELGACIY